MMPVSHLLENRYKQTIEKGKQHLENKQIIFTMLARDCENSIENCVRKLIEAIEDYTDQYFFVIYENDSTDDTRSLLVKLAKEFPTHIHLIFEDLDAPKFGSVKDPKRVELLAKYRNVCLTHVKEEFPNSDYTIVCDSDFIDISKEGIIHSFGVFEASEICHAICGNSFQLKQHDNGKSFLWNYDSWAFRDGHWHDISYDYNEFCVVPESRSYGFGFWYPAVGMNPKVVNSGFGGMAIYKTTAYIQGAYSGLDCEHVMLHWKLQQEIPNFTLVLNPALRMLMP